MNIISLEKRRKILELSYEGESVRSISKKVRVRWETAKKYRDQYNQLIDETSKEVEPMIQSELDQLKKEGIPGIIKKLLRL